MDSRLPPQLDHLVNNVLCHNLTAQLPLAAPAICSGPPLHEVVDVEASVSPQQIQVNSSLKEMYTKLHDFANEKRGDGGKLRV